MRRAPLALLCTAACAILYLPVPASAIPIHRHHERVVYRVDTDGAKVPIDVIRWTEKYDVAPPYVAPEPIAVDSPALIASTPAATSVAPAPVSTGGCPSYMAAEASSPDAINPSSGAAGCYQILPSTQAAHGCADVGPDCAAIICATEGPGAWASSGANPCPYLQP